MSVNVAPSLPPPGYVAPTCTTHSVKVCRECDSVFPVGARLDSAVTSEELREKFSFEPEFNKDGTPMVRAPAVSV